MATYTPTAEAQAARLRPAYKLMELAKEGEGKGRFADGPRKGEPVSRSWLNRRLERGDFPNTWLDETHEPPRYMIPGVDLGAAGITVRDTWRDNPDEQPQPPEPAKPTAAAAEPGDVDAATQEVNREARAHNAATAAEHTRRLEDRIVELESALADERARREDAERRLALNAQHIAVLEAEKRGLEGQVQLANRALGVLAIGPGGDGPANRTPTPGYWVRLGRALIGKPL